MSELLDAIDAADPWAVIAVVMALLYALELLTAHLRRRAHRIENALEFLKGYETGVRHAREGLTLIGPRDVPEAFAREFRS